MESHAARDAVQDFYDLHPYPPPVDDLEGYRQRWQDESRRCADFYLHWPDKTYRANLEVLVAGCGTSQAAKLALRQPLSGVVGIDVSATSVGHTGTLKHKYGLSNLEVYQLPLERAGELASRFDKIVCTGVLHHLPNPEEGLRALREVLKPDGAMHLMVYATYGRAGVYMLQEYCRRLGVGHTEAEIQDLAITLTALPRGHPLAQLLGESPDFRRKDGLADALLNPQDRAYTVPQLLNLIERCDLTFGRWVRQAPYLPQCGDLSRTPHSASLARLPKAEQYTAVELFRGTMLRHSLIVYRDDGSTDCRSLRFDGDHWHDYVPIRLPETISLQKRVPAGAAAVLINQAHTDPDLYLPVTAQEKQWYDAIDREHTIEEITCCTSTGDSRQRHLEGAKAFFERLWWYDQVVFDTSRQAGNVRM